MQRNKRPVAPSSRTQLKVPDVRPLMQQDQEQDLETAIQKLAARFNNIQRETNDCKIKLAGFRMLEEEVVKLTAREKTCAQINQINKAKVNALKSELLYTQMQEREQLMRTLVEPDVNDSSELKKLKTTNSHLLSEIAQAHEDLRELSDQINSLLGDTKEIEINVSQTNQSIGALTKKVQVQVTKVPNAPKVPKVMSGRDAMRVSGLSTLNTREKTPKPQQLTANPKNKNTENSQMSSTIRSLLLPRIVPR